MKRHLLSLLAALGLLFGSVAFAADPSPRLAPALTFKDVATGQKLSLESLKGKVVVVDFWATWCEPCKTEIPGYIELQNKYGAKGLVVVGVSVDTKKASAVKKFATEHAMNYQVVMGSIEDIDAFTGAAGAEVMLPSTFLIDREGKIIHSKKGVMDHAEYEAIVAKAL